MRRSASVAQVAIDIVMGRNTVTSVVKDALGEVNRVVSDSASTTQQKMGAVGMACTSIGGAILPVSTAVGGLGVVAANSAISFESSMAKVQTIAGKTAVSYKGNTQSMSDAIKALSSDTGIAAGEVADATYQAISAGVDTSKSVEFVANANALAVGGFTDMTSAVDVLTTTINAYGLKADDASMISDRLITTQNLGKTTVDELAGSIGRVIPSASAYGVSIDNLCASYVEMTKGGIATSEATTYMKSMLNELADSGSTVGKVLQEQTGKGFTELMQSGASLGDVMDVLGQSVNGDATAFAQLWGSQEAGTGALSILNAGCTDFNNVLQQMGNSTGAANSAMETMNDTTKHKLKVALNGVKNAGIELGETLLTTFGPALESICKSVSNLCTWFGNLPGPVKTAITVVLGIVAAAGPVLIFIGKIATGISGLISIVGKVGSVLKLLPAIFTALTSPVGIVIAVIGALVGGFIYLWNTSEGFRNFWTGLWDGIKNICKTVVDAICGFFTETIPNAWNNVVSFFQGIPEWWSGLWEQVKTFFSNAWQAILENPIVQMVVDAISNIWNIAKDTLSGIWNGICSIASGVWELIKNVILGPVVLLIDLVTGNFSKLSEDARNIWENIKNAASSIWDGIKQVVVSYATGLLEGVKAAFSGLKDIAAGIWDAIKATASTIWSGLKDFVIGTAHSLKDGAVDAFENMVSGIGNAVSWIGSTVTDGFHTAIDFITSLPGKALEWGRDFIDGLVNGIKSGVKKIKGAVKDVASTIRSFLHFSVPDVGPLTDYESWMPDFMKGLSAGIDSNKRLVAQSVRSVADSMVISPILAQTQEAPRLKNVGAAQGYYQEREERSLEKLVKLLEKYVRGSEPKESNGSAFSEADYKKFGEAVSLAIEGMGVYMNAKPVGKMVTPEVNNEFGKIKRRRT